MFISPGHQFVFAEPGPNLYLPALASGLCLPALALNLYLPALVYNFITSPGSEFCIYLIIGSSSNGSCNSSNSNFFGIDNTNICMPILVN